jgi:hypothetical protein
MPYKQSLMRLMQSSYRDQHRRQRQPINLLHVPTVCRPVCHRLTQQLLHRCGNFVPEDGLNLHICTSAPAFLNAAMISLGMAETGARPWLKRCRFCKQALRADPGSYHTCSAAVFSHSLFDLSCSRSSSRSSGGEHSSQLHPQQQQRSGPQERERAAKLRTEFIGHVASVFVCPGGPGNTHGSETRSVSDAAAGYAGLLQSCTADEAAGLLFFNGMVASSSLGPAAGRGLYTVSRISAKEPPAGLLNTREYSSVGLTTFD